MAQKPGIPKGTRDFSPAEVAKRQYIMTIMRSNFEKFGYQPIETPSFENSETLMGKYGEEGDRLIFRILDSGEYFQKNEAEFKEAIQISSAATTFFEKVLSTLWDLNSLNYLDLVDFLDKNIRGFSLNSDLGDIDRRSFKHFEDYVLAQKNTISMLVAEQRHAITDDVISFERFKEFQMREFVSKCVKSFIDKYVTKNISEKALRYDLTVPFARYVVQHQNDLQFPFKRYQIQPVWRADRPQKGRFREFYQCDADVVGSNSLWQEVELVQLYDSVFADLGLDGATIKINNRKILSGIAETIGAKDKLIDFTVALDKLDKIGADGVKTEMLGKGISAEAIEKVQPLFSFDGNVDEKLEKLSALLSESEEGKKGIEELRFICDNVKALGLKGSVLDLDVTLARGLNYYTGAIFEVSAPKVAMGSIGGGGRYDDLTGIFGLKNMSGVGISFGLDRIYLVLEELDLFPETVTSAPTALFLNLGESEALFAMQAVTELRNANIRVDMYPDKAKFDKQFKFAEKRNITYVVTVGEQELLDGNYSVKNLVSGQKSTVSLSELKELFLENF